jgi:hypothetical protein
LQHQLNVQRRKNFEQVLNAHPTWVGLNLCNARLVEPQGLGELVLGHLAVQAKRAQVLAQLCGELDGVVHGKY